jgi:phosphoserine phosphatase RsbU/P
MDQGFWRKNIMLMLGGLLGALILSQVMEEVSPRASFEFTLTRNDICEKATLHLRSLGFDPKTYQQDAVFRFDGLTHLQLQGRGGIPGANAAFRADTLVSHEWQVSWYDRSLPVSQFPESFQIWMSPAGRPLGFERKIPDSTALTSLPHADARLLAEKFLSSQHVDLSKYALLNASELKLAGRVDHRFEWSRTESGAEMRVSVRVQGDVVGGYRVTVEPGAELRRGFSDTMTTLTFLNVIAVGVLFFLFFVVVVLFLKKYHEGEVGTQTAFLVFIGIFGVSILLALNEYAGSGAFAIIGDLNKFNTRIVLFGVNVFIVQLFMGVLAFAAWSVGESSSRSVYPAKMRGADSALLRKYLTYEFGIGIVQGYAWGFLLFGAYAAGMYLLLKTTGMRLYVSGVANIPDATLPALHPVLMGFVLAALCEIVFRLFFLCVLREKTGKGWPGVLISVVLWSGAGIALWDVPLGITGPVGAVVVMALFGLAFSFLFIRFDLVTTIVANFVITAVNAAIPMLTGGSGYAGELRWTFLAIMALPLLVGVIGVVRRQRFEFTIATMPRHIQRISERERMSKELEIARNVQMSLLPKSNPQLPGCDIAGVCIPAREVGGDYYDYVLLEDGRLGVTIGDVSGKGVPAAIYMTLTKGILQSHAEDNISPRNVLVKVNSLMYRSIERNSFVSMFYAILDMKRGTMRFARAGQCPMILMHRVGGETTLISPKGMALGLEMGKVFDSVLEEEELPLESGQVMVFYTDGFTEAMNATSEEFGEERLLAAVTRHNGQPAYRIIEAVCAEVTEFTGDRPQHDDMTMVVVKIV